MGKPAYWEHGLSHSPLNSLSIIACLSNGFPWKFPLSNVVVVTFGAMFRSKSGPEGKEYKE